LVQKRIGKLALRKYKLANSVNCSLYAWRRLITTRRPRRTASEIELTFNESTSLSAPFLRIFGMRRPKDSFSGETGCSEVMVVITPDIF
jgi:hypothetical protein